MKKKNLIEEKKNRKEEREMDRKLEKLENELEELQKQLREKEQENRISQMKIKQYKRTIKQAKLKPMQPLEESKDKDRSKSKPAPKGASKMPINQYKNNVPVKKQVPVKEQPKVNTSQNLAEAQVNSSMDNTQKSMTKDQKLLGNVKPPFKEGKGTFETEVHL